MVVDCWLLLVGCWLLLVGCCLLPIDCCWLAIVGCCFAAAAAVSEKANPPVIPLLLELPLLHLLTNAKNDTRRGQELLQGRLALMPPCNSQCCRAYELKLCPAAM